MSGIIGPYCVGMLTKDWKDIAVIAIGGPSAMTDVRTGKTMGYVSQMRIGDDGQVETRQVLKVVGANQG